MASIYENAYCTIAATSAKDGTEGCYTPREYQALACLPCRPGEPNEGSMYFSVKDKTSVKRMLTGPLNSRAWVLQERIFSRRTIHFAEDQVYWECDKIFVGEDGTNARNAVGGDFWPTRSLLYCILEDFLGTAKMPRLITPRPESDHFPKKQFYTIWAQLVRQYSRCGLTNEMDKLPALLSLSTELGQLLDDEYHAGHWFIRPLPQTRIPFFFLSSLLWQAEDGVFLNRPTSQRAPSWSWASLNGSLDWADMFGPILASIIHLDEYYLDFSAFQMWQPVGLPASKALLLSGVLSKASVCTACCSAQNLLQQCSACVAFRQSSLKCEKCQIPRMQNQLSLFDERDSRIAGTFVYDLATMQPTEFWLLPIYCRAVGEEVPLICHVLLLEEVIEQKKEGTVFRRIGIGHVEDQKCVTNGKKRFLVLI